MPNSNHRAQLGVFGAIRARYPVYQEGVTGRFWSNNGFPARMSFRRMDMYTLLRKQRTRLLSDRLSLLYPEDRSQAVSVDGFFSEFFRVKSP